MSAGLKLLDLFGRLELRKGIRWNDYQNPGELEVTDKADAQVATSILRSDPGRHIVALDIDYPAHLAESSTPGHYHLYLDVPGGVDHEAYMDLLELLGELNIIETGYANASRGRGFSCPRLPWVHKGES